MPETQQGIIAHVVAFEPNGERCMVGGFHWYPTPEEADAALQLESEADGDSHTHMRFDVLVASYDVATDVIDSAWGEWEEYAKEWAESRQPIDLR